METIAATVVCDPTLRLWMHPALWEDFFIVVECLNCGEILAGECIALDENSECLPPPEFPERCPGCGRFIFPCGRLLEDCCAKPYTALVLIRNSVEDAMFFCGRCGRLFIIQL